MKAMKTTNNVPIISTAWTVIKRQVMRLFRYNVEVSVVLVIWVSNNGKALSVCPIAIDPFGIFNLFL